MSEPLTDAELAEIAARSTGSQGIHAMENGWRSVPALLGHIAALEAERERMQPVVEAACLWEDMHMGLVPFCNATGKLHWAIVAYRATLSGDQAGRGGPGWVTMRFAD